MIIIDVNLLVHAVNEHSPQHLRAKEWLETALSGNQTIGLPWMVLLAFLRLSTRPGVFPQPLSIGGAFELIETWIARPNVTIPEPTPMHWRTLRDILNPIGVGGNLIMDAHLAALAIEYGAELCSADRDFGRFRRLRWRDPLG